jgi:hypothetical protein
MEEKMARAHAAGNDVEQVKPNGAGPPPEATLQETVARASELLLPNPDALLSETGEQVLIPVVNRPGDVEFFRTHPTIRLTMPMVTPKKGKVGAQTYGVLPSMQHLLLKHKFTPFAVTLYPIVIAGNPLSYKLVRVRLPSAGRGWDTYNLARKIVLDRGVNEWVAMRVENESYVAVPPHPEAIFPEVVFPDYTAEEWLERSLYAAGLVIRDETHEVFREIQHL